MYPDTRCFPATASASTARHTFGPAIPSTTRPCSSWNIITAPRVISFGRPAFHSTCSSWGVDGYRQKKRPAGGATAAATSLRMVVRTSLPAGTQSTGRYPSCASSCCRRTNDAGAIARCSPAAARFAPATTTGVGNRTVRLESNGAPLPDGRKTSVWLSTCSQRPGTDGTSAGFFPSSTCDNGSENVSLIGASGLVRASGPGDDSTTGRSAGGNHVTRTGAPSVSHGRAAVASRSDPATDLVGSVTVLPATSAPATEVRSTGMSKRTCACPPRGTVTHRSTAVATGVSTVSVSRRSAPSAQLDHPGRRTTTETAMRSPGASGVRGVSLPCETTSGTGRPPGPRARTLASEPANGCSFTRASAEASPPSVTPEKPRTAAAQTAAASTTTASATKSPRCERLRAGGRLLRPRGGADAAMPYRVGAGPRRRRRGPGAAGYDSPFAFRNAAATASGVCLLFTTAAFIARIAFCVSFASTLFSVLFKSAAFEPSDASSLFDTSGATFCTPKMSFGSLRTTYLPLASCGSVEKTSMQKTFF